jgi:N-acetylneuraminic acid mutarotase/L-ascorbate metabolism protein UlaG (beta-lactamase superfamily)
MFTWYRFILVIIILTTYITANEFEWNKKANLPTTARNGAAVTCGNKVYFMGGSGSLVKNYEYDPTTDTWTNRKNLLTMGWNLALGTVKGKIYAFGGDFFMNRNEVYDPVTDSWKKLTPMPTARQHLKCGVVNDKIYVLAGLEQGTVQANEGDDKWDGKAVVSNKNERYDPGTDTWQVLAPMPVPMHSPNAYVAVVGDLIYVMGGMGDSTSIWTSLKTVEAYDTKTDTWEIKSDLPFPYLGGATVINNAIYALGITEAGTAKIARFDAVANEWQIIGDIPVLRWQAGMTSYNNSIYIIGGNDDNFNPFADVYEVKILPPDIKVTYIANAGFLIESPTQKVLIDALFTTSFGEYLTPSSQLRSQIVNGEAPFNDVDLYLVTHNHADHFDASLVAQFLSKNPNTQLIAPQDATSLMTSLNQYEAIKNQIHGITLERYKYQELTLNEIDLKIVRLVHSGGGATPINLGFIFDLNGRKILHIGDNTCDDKKEFETYLLNQENIDLGFLNYYSHWQNSTLRNFTNQYINPKQIVLYHIPPAEVNQIVTQASAITKNFPPITVFQKSLDNKTFSTNTTSISIPGKKSILLNFKLQQNYPNPFYVKGTSGNSATTIQYSLAHPCEVKLVIYNLLGQKIRTLQTGFLNSGNYSLVWDGRDETNNYLPTGMYFYRLETDEILLQKKIAIVR